MQELQNLVMREKKLEMEACRELMVQAIRESDKAKHERSKLLTENALLEQRLEDMAYELLRLKRELQVAVNINTHLDTTTRAMAKQREEMRDLKERNKSLEKEVRYLYREFSGVGKGNLQNTFALNKGRYPAIEDKGRACSPVTTSWAQSLRND